MTTTKYEYLNTGKIISLGELISSNDVQDDNLIQVFDAEGHFIVQDAWFSDSILNRSDCIGTARKIGSGGIISFNLAQDNPSSGVYVSIRGLENILKRDDPLVDFELLFDLSQDGSNGVDFATIIEAMELQGIQMTDSVRRLGVCLGILSK